MHTVPDHMRGCWVAVLKWIHGPQSTPDTYADFPSHRIDFLALSFLKISGKKGLKSLQFPEFLKRYHDKPIYPILRSELEKTKSHREYSV